METPLGNEIVVGEIIRAEEFEEARKPKMFKLWIDLGEHKVQSAAQLGYNHSIDGVEGLKVLCVTDLGEVKITDFRSEVLTLGVPDKNGNPVLVTPEIDVPKGGKLY
jgi:tRNA-binding protein